MTFNYKDYENMIYKIIYMFTKDKNLVEDLYQQGILGLINAKEHYDKSVGVKFSTFAYRYIFGEIYSYFNKVNHAYKVNTNHIKFYKLIKKAKEYLTQEFKREVSTKEIASYLEVSEDEIVSNINLMKQGLSINYDYDNQEFKDLIKIEENYDTIAVSDMLEQLSEDQRKVLEYKYFGGYSQKEIAKLMNTSQSSVSRLEKNGLTRIRTKESKEVYKSVNV